MSKNINFSSLFGIGRLVKFNPEEGVSVDAHVRVAIFTKSKVRYSIRLKQLSSTIHNVDSNLITEHELNETISLPNDNYS